MTTDAFERDHAITQYQFVMADDDEREAIATQGGLSAVPPSNSVGSIPACVQVMPSRSKKWISLVFCLEPIPRHKDGHLEQRAVLGHVG